MLALACFLAALVLLAIAAGLQLGAGALADGRDLTLPDPLLTPGVVRSDIDQGNICTTRWGKDRRFVTAAMKREVFTRYGLTGNKDGSTGCQLDKHGRRFELDHLISRELGGADDADNIWPQCYSGKPWNAVRKDRVENRLHKEVCAGNVTLQDAQREVSVDYRIPYIRYFGEPQ